MGKQTKTTYTCDFCNEEFVDGVIYIDYGKCICNKCSLTKSLVDISRLLQLDAYRIQEHDCFSIDNTFVGYDVETRLNWNSIECQLSNTMNTITVNTNTIKAETLRETADELLLLLSDSESRYAKAGRDLIVWLRERATRIENEPDN